MPLMEKEHYTIEDIYALPEGERAELIDGQMYMMAPPGRRHQWLSTYLLTEISLYIRSKKGTCEVYSAPFGVFLKNDEEDYVDPDRKEIVTYQEKDERFLMKYKFREPVQVGIYEGLEITIAQETCEIRRV